MTVFLTAMMDTATTVTVMMAIRTVMKVRSSV
jgi:hypothetical protein